MRDTRPEYPPEFDEEEGPPMDPAMVYSIADLARQVCATQDTVESISHRIYKYTDCGAWVSHQQEDLTVAVGWRNDPSQVAIGSIVEGADYGTEVHELTFPFSMDDFWKAVDAVEEEANQIWQETHGCFHEDCISSECHHCHENYENRMRYIHPECPHCGGAGEVI